MNDLKEFVSVLVKVSNGLDDIALWKDADGLDNFLVKLAQDESLQEKFRRHLSGVTPESEKELKKYKDQIDKNIKAFLEWKEKHEKSREELMAETLEEYGIDE